MQSIGKGDSRIAAVPLINDCHCNGLLRIYLDKRSRVWYATYYKSHINISRLRIKKKRNKTQILRLGLFGGFSCYGAPYRLDCGVAGRTVRFPAVGNVPGDYTGVCRLLYGGWKNRYEMLLVHCVCAFWKRGWQLSMHSFYPRGGLNVSFTHLSWINIWRLLCLEGIALCRCLVVVNIKQSHYKPGQALRVPGGWGSLLSRQSANDGGKVASLIHCPPLPLKEIFLVLISLRGWVKARVVVQPEGLLQLKIAVTQSESKPRPSFL